MWPPALLPADCHSLCHHQHALKTQQALNEHSVNDGNPLHPSLLALCSCNVAKLLDSLKSLYSPEMPYQSHNGWGWKGPLQVSWPSPTAPAGTPRAAWPGQCPGGNKLLIKWESWLHESRENSCKTEIQFYHFTNTSLLHFTKIIILSLERTVQGWHWCMKWLWRVLEAAECEGSCCLLVTQISSLGWKASLFSPWLIKTNLFPCIFYWVYIKGLVWKSTDL